MSFVDSLECFQFLVDPTNSATINEKLIANMKKFLVPAGTSCIVKDIGLFKVTLIEIKPDQENVLVVSLSHVIGDSIAFDALHGTQEASSSVEFLDSEGSRIVGTVNGNEFSTCIKFIVSVIRAVTNTPPKDGIYSMAKAIARVKKDLMFSLKERQFVSTNDSITSWFYRLCRSQYGMMSLNCCHRYMIGGPIEVLPGRESLTSVDLATLIDDYNACVRARPMLVGYCFLRVLENADKLLVLRALSARQRLEVYQTRAIVTAEWINILHSVPLVGVYKIYRCAYVGEQFGILRNCRFKTSHAVAICQVTGSATDHPGRPYHSVLVMDNHANRIKEKTIRNPSWSNRQHELDSSENRIK